MSISPSLYVYLPFIFHHITEKLQWLFLFVFVGFFWLKVENELRPVENQDRNEKEQ